MAPHRIVVVFLLAWLPACTATRAVRLDLGQGEPLLHIPSTDSVEWVELEEEEFIQAISREVRLGRPAANPEKDARELFEVPPRSGWYGYSQRQGIVPLDGQIGASQGTELDGRYALGMSFAIEQIVPEMMQSFQGMADPEAIKASLYWTMTLYAAMWLLPEPFSKGLAAGVTVGLICYVGIDTPAHGRLHPDCFLPESPSRCPQCGRMGVRLPESLLLEADSLPERIELFRLTDFETTLVGTERFVEAVQRLGLDGANCHELPLR
jgi:hypothetical protein